MEPKYCQVLLYCERALMEGVPVKYVWRFLYLSKYFRLRHILNHLLDADRIKACQ